MLYVTRGLPACGKTTRAVAWVAEDPDTRTRVNRDDLRRMVHGAGAYSPARERAVTAVELAGVEALLRDRWHVVVDDTNLNPAALLALTGIAVRLGVRHQVWDMTDVPLDVCIERDKARGPDTHVGAKAIRRMYDEWLAT